MSWNFALAASRSGVPGYTPYDARDLYDAMQKILGVLRARYDVQPTSVSFLGASLGALEGAYLSVIDEAEGKIGIQKYLLINPPIDLEYAVARIDGWAALTKKFGKEKAALLRGKALSIVEPLSNERRDDPVIFERLVRDFSGFTTEEQQYLIAAAAEIALPELIYVTQVLDDQHVLQAAPDEQRTRLEEAREVTLMDYIVKIAMPRWRLEDRAPRADLAEVSRRASLAAVVEDLRANPRVHILHNADDLLSERGQIEALKQTMGDRMTLYPYGGHLGNLWYFQNKNYLLTFFGRYLGTLMAAGSSAAGIAAVSEGR